jgi:hypothetical protein
VIDQSWVEQFPSRLLKKKVLLQVLIIWQKHTVNNYPTKLRLKVNFFGLMKMVWLVQNCRSNKCTCMYFLKPPELRGSVLEPYQGGPQGISPFLQFPLFCTWLSPNRIFRYARYFIFIQQQHKWNCRGKLSHTHPLLVSLFVR